MKILVAEDEIISLRMIERILERAGYEVIAVNDGRKAVEQLCRVDGPRIALIDWMMPELDGPGVCREVRKHDQHYIHILVLTSKNSKRDVVEALEAGANDFLVKPFDSEELKARIGVGMRILRLEDDLVQAREDMRYKATHDALTSLLSRGAILDMLARELARTRRENGCTSALMLDLDHFKSVNDRYGHLVGDEVLREVSRRMLGRVRAYDFVGRFGGEEFLVVLNNCAAVNAFERAEDLRRIIAESPIETPSGPVPITASIGVFSSDEFSSLVVEAVLQQADRALYAAKAAGRNCSRIATPISIMDSE
jgi:two-component system, cell cycle response regulator